MLPNTYNQNMEIKSIGRGKLEILNQGMEHLNIAILGVSQLK